jgi:hypothetical protein
MTNDIKINLGGVEGIYTFKAVNITTGKERELKGISPNIITNAGLNAIGSSDLLLNNIVVGTGNSTPVGTDTALGNQVASTSTVQTSSNGCQSTAPYFLYYSVTMRFPQGGAAGNLTEVGMQTSSGVLFSRALILDSGGNPTTLTILSDEYLDVTYQYRIYPNTTDTNASLTLSGTTYTVVFRPASISSYTNSYCSYGLAYNGSTFTAYNGDIDVITSVPSGTASFTGNYSTVNYTSGSKQLTFVLTAGLDDGNFSGGISAFYMAVNNGAFQFSVDPPIPKDNFKILVLNVSLGWDIYTP